MLSVEYLGPFGLMTVAVATQDKPTLYLSDFIRDFKPKYIPTILVSC